MYHVVCCNGYYNVGSFNSKTEALKSAKEHIDGTYVCIITRDGRIVGDSVDGYHEPYNEYCPDAATLTGMYDRF